MATHRLSVKMFPGAVVIKTSQSVCIETSPELVWKQLAKLEDIVLWSSDVLEATCTGYGVGEDRHCRLRGNVKIKEHIVEWVEGKSLTYEGLGLPLVKRALNKWSVYPDGKFARLVSEAEVELKGGIFGRAFEPLMSLMIKRMAPRALFSFKFLVENGKPFRGANPDLGKISPNC